MRCPLCERTLRLTDKPWREVPAGKQEPRDCECGVEAWISRSTIDDSPFVAAFVPNRVMRVRLTR